MDALSMLRCPLDQAELTLGHNQIVCSFAHAFPVVEGVPVFLFDDDEPTLSVARASYEAAKHAGARSPGDLFLDTLGVSEAERAAIRTLPAGPVDPVVSMLAPGTCGNLYVHSQGRFTDYPIPALRLPAGHGEWLLDIGCGWGRWSLAAARSGYRVIGLDPSLGAVLAAKRVSAQLALPATFVVGDARRLPLLHGSMNVAFSYSVCQHLSRTNVRRVLEEVARVLAPDGTAFVQMPNRCGLRNLYHQVRYGFADASDFGVRYYALSELRRLFTGAIGPASISVDGFFGLGIQPSDARHFHPLLRLVSRASEILRKISVRVPLLTYLADSVYVHARREPRTS